MSNIASMATEPEPPPVGVGAEAYPTLIASLDPAVDADLITALEARYALAATAAGVGYTPITCPEDTR